ncbi:MAG: signal peptidase I, partial [Eubacteriales bacterium]|nr:signal peptidase I [Eubacteriales bacterium]
MRQTKPRQAGAQKGAMREIAEWLVTLAGAIVIALLIHAYIGQGYTVLGPSMQPTLFTGERVVIGKLTYRLAEPQRGDIVVVKYPKSATNPAGENSYVKRVIGVPGDTLEVRDGRLIRNGDVVDEPYIKE